MGTIVSPVNGTTVYKNAIVPIVYRSDTVNFNCGSLSAICTIIYRLNTVNVSGSVNISQTGVAPQTQSAYNMTMPSSGATAAVDVEGWGVGGQQNDTVAVSYNLADAPTAACSAATLITSTTATLNGTIAGTLLAGGSARFVWGSPTPTTNAATTYAVGAINANITGLTPNAVYNYRLEVLDSFGNIVATSSQCSLTTLAAPVTTSCDVDLVSLCNITGVTRLCNTTTQAEILLITVTSKNGDVIPTDSTAYPAPTGYGVFTTIGFFRSYYADLTGNYLTPQPITVGSCAAADVEAVDFCMRANTAGAGYAIGDQIKLTRWFNTATNLQVSEVAFNMTAGGATVATPLTAANFDECPSAGGASETIVCAAGVNLIRRVDSVTGAITFIGSNGVAVAAPPAYTVGACPSEIEFEILCDNNGSFLRRYTRNLDGTIAITNTTLDGTTVYAPVGTVKACFSPISVDSRMANVAGTAVAATTQAIGALVPVGKTMISLSFSVLAGTANLTDFAGTVITALPVGYSANWSADVVGTLNFPQSVTAAINSRVVLVYTLR